MRRPVWLLTVAFVLALPEAAFAQEACGETAFCSDARDLRNQRAGLNQDEFLENGAGKFAVDIPGCPVASANIQSVRIGDLTVDVRETTRGVDWDYDTFEPGEMHLGPATFKSRLPADSDEARLWAAIAALVGPRQPAFLLAWSLLTSEADIEMLLDLASRARSATRLLQWLRLAAQGKHLRKNIAIIVKDRAGNEARRYNLMECFPIKFDPGNFSPSRTTRTITVVTSCDGVEFAFPDDGEDDGNPPALADRHVPDEMLVSKGFRIEVTGPSGGKNEDNAWETCTGGALCIEVAPASVENDQFHIATPGHKFVGEVRLRGPMTKSRRWIGKNINDTVRGIFNRFDLTVVEIMKDGSDGKRFNYEKTFFIRYVFPVLSADGTGNLYEEVIFKPERLGVADPLCR